MANKDEEQSPRLGHDPLEWLDDDETPEPDGSVTQEQRAQAPATELEEVPEDVVSPEPHLPVNTEPDDSAKGEVDVEVQSESSAEAAIETEAEHEDSSTLSIRDGKAEIELPAKLLVQVVDELHQQWSSLFAAEMPEQLWLNAQHTEDADAAGIQLLYALVHQLSIKGCEVHIVDVGPGLDRRFRQSGLSALFGPFMHAA